METYINPNAITGFEEASTGDVIAKLDDEHIGFTQAGSGLPDQTGQSGKFLTTDGLQATWSEATNITIRNWTYE